MVFSYWIAHNAVGQLPPSYDLLLLALPLGTLMGVLNPFLFSTAERAIVRWMIQVEHDSDFGWNGPLAIARDRIVRRWYYPVCAVGVAGAVVILTYAEPHVRPYSPLPLPGDWALAIKYIVLSFAGFSALSDLHVVIRWLVAVRRRCQGTELKWTPFPPPRYPSLGEAYRISFMVAFSFSLGALWVPLLFVVNKNLEPVGRTLVWVFIALLTVGGLLAFTVPFASIVFALRRSKQRYRDSIDAPIGRVLESFTHPPDETLRTTRRACPKAVAGPGTRSRRLALCPSAVRLAAPFSTIAVPVASLAVSFSGRPGLPAASTAAGAAAGTGLPGYARCEPGQPRLWCLPPAGRGLDVVGVGGRHLALPAGLAGFVPARREAA